MFHAPELFPPLVCTSPVVGNVLGYDCSEQTRYDGDRMDNFVKRPSIHPLRTNSFFFFYKATRVISREEHVRTSNILPSFLLCVDSVGGKKGISCFYHMEVPSPAGLCIKYYVPRYRVWTNNLNYSVEKGAASAAGACTEREKKSG